MFDGDAIEVPDAEDESLVLDLVDAFEEKSLLEHRIRFVADDSRLEHFLGGGIL